MKNSVRIILYGVLIWGICFLIGFIIWPLYESRLMLYKSIMVVSSVLTGMIFINLYFTRIKTDYLRLSIPVGLVWLAVNLLLDLVVLVGLFGTPVGEYFVSVGLRYLGIPVMVIGTGILLEKKV